MSDGDQKTAYGKTNHTMDTEEVLYHYIISLPFSQRLLFFSFFFHFSFISSEIITFFFFFIRETTLRPSTSGFNYLKKRKEILIENNPLSLVTFPPLCSLLNSDGTIRREA